MSLVAPFCEHGVYSYHGLYRSTSCYYTTGQSQWENGARKSFFPRLFFFFFFFLITSARAQVAPVDWSAPKLACKCGFGHGCAFWGSRWWPITFRGSDPPKTKILGARIGISSQIYKKFKSLSWISMSGYNFGVDQHFRTKFGKEMENWQPKGTQCSEIRFS